MNLVFQNKRKIQSIIIIFFTIFTLSLIPIITIAGSETPFVDCEEPDECDFKKLGETLDKVMTWIVELSVMIGTALICIAGFQYLTAAGNMSKISKAHTMISQAMVGMFIALAAWLIIKALLNTLDYNPDVVKINNFK